MPNIVGANAKFALGRETEFGVPPASGWKYFAAASFALAENQSILDNDLIGQGTNAKRPERDVSDYTGNIVVPVDLRAFGYWLTLLFGEPVTTAAKAGGALAFSAQPDNGATITLAGQAFTFTTGTPGTAEIELGDDLDATLDNVVVALNAASGAAAAASYARDGQSITITHDAAGTAGNAFTLAASPTAHATPSAATLAAGGYQHVWDSSTELLPSFSVERQHPDARPDPIFAVYRGVKASSMNLVFESSGHSTMTLACQYQAQDRTTTGSIAGAPDTIAVERFSHRRNFIRKDGQALGKVTQATIPFNLNAENVRYVGGQGEIGDINPGIRESSGQLVCRFQDLALFDLAKNEETFELSLGFQKKPAEGGWSLTFDFAQVEIGNPSDPVSGPGAVQATFPLIASAEDTTGNMLLVTLVNDWPDYAV